MRVDRVRLPMFSVLHIDNSTFFKKLLKDAFTNHGCHYIPSSNMAAAFEILESQRVDMILTALELEKGNGDEFLKQINTSKFNNIPVVVISSTDSLEKREQMFALGAIDFIPKDISHDQIITYVQKLTRKDIVESKLKELSIAVLDDSATSLNIIRNILTLNGIKNVDYFNTVDDFLSAEKVYSIYLVDVILPKMSGEHLIFELRKKYKNSVIIAISAIDHYKTISNILLSGADDYIMKPFNTSIFMARIKANVRTFLLLNEIEEKNKELSRMVIRDGLTKTYSHNYMYERMEKEVKEAERYKKKLAVVMFDIDDFKKTNDQFGHQVGDMVLVKVADTIMKSFREVDIVGRYGGEEFLVILPETDLDHAKISAERARGAVENIVFREKKLKVTISGGVAEFEKETALQLVEKADKLLYISKDNGKNRIS